MKQFVWILILVFALIACAPKETPTPTEVPTNTPKDTSTSTPIPTLTPTEVPPTATSTDVPEPTVTETAEDPDPLANYPDAGYGPVKFPENINPLTGLLVENPEILDRRPVAVKDIERVAGNPSPMGFIPGRPCV